MSRICIECGDRATFQVEPGGGYDHAAWEPQPVCEEHLAREVVHYASEINAPVLVSLLSG